MRCEYSLDYGKSLVDLSGVHACAPVVDGAFDVDRAVDNSSDIIDIEGASLVPSGAGEQQKPFPESLIMLPVLYQDVSKSAFRQFEQSGAQTRP